MAIKSVFICSECGYKSPKWYGRCPGCSSGNTLNEELYETKKDKLKGKLSVDINKDNIPISMEQVVVCEDERYKTSISELNKLLGGGIVKGSLILIGGAPGVGKSTLLLQIVNGLKDVKILYVSGEETKSQIKIRANRLSLKLANMYIMSEMNIDEIIFQIDILKPELIIIDSIQTMYKKGISSVSGSVTQVRECSSILLEFSKKNNISVIIVSHVNKDGAIAGPKVLEHLVDVVLYFEELVK